MRFSILGPLTVLDGAGAPVPVGGARLRRLLVLLLLEPGRTVGADRLIDGIWGEDAPANAANALQALVSRLRRQLGSPSAILGDAAGYRLDADPSQVDLWEFDGLVRRGRRARAAGDRREAVRLLEAALRLWRGDPVPELGEAGGEGEAARLAEQHRGARGELLEARLEDGEHSAVLPELEALAAREPLREHTTELLIRALAASGRTADALAAYQRLRSRLAEELGIDPSERLAGLHLRLLRGEALEPPGPAREPLDLGARPAPVTRLPSMLTSFVAREEVGTALGLLAEERLLTLVGPGGAGKTRLSVEVGGRLAADRPDLVPDGVWFVDLSSLRAEGGVPVTLLDVVGMRERVVSPLQIAEHTDPIERALEVFGDKRLLLIVDNCEHLIDEVTDVVARMLPACPGVRIMATSREPIGITGERLLAVPPLELPPEGAAAEEARGYPAVQLFADRVRAFSPGFEVDGGNAAAVVRICRELDGMPLALELAAVRVRAMPLPQLAERLSDRFRLLAGGPRSVRPRHQTLEAVVDWSWELLDGAERTLLRRLAVFGGGAALDAVEAVCSDGEGGGSGDVAGRDVWSVLFSLVDKSLVIADGAAEADRGQPRYRMLETVRAYGMRRLVESGELERVRRAHARFLIGLWDGAGERLLGPDQLVWLRRLRAEQDDHQATLRWAVEHGDLDTAFALVHATLPHGQLGEGWSVLAREAAALIEQVGDEPPPGHEAAYAECLLLRTAEYDLGRAGKDDEDSIARAERALFRVEEIAREHPEAARGNTSLLMAPLMLAMLGHDREGMLRRLDAAAAELPRWQSLMVESFSAMLVREVFLGRGAEARSRFVRVLGQLRDAGERWIRSHVCFMLAELEGLSDPERELALMDEAIEASEGLELVHQTVALRARRAVVLARAGRGGEARRELEEVEGARLEGESRLMLNVCRAEVARWTEGPEAARGPAEAALENAVGGNPFVRVQLEPFLRVQLARMAAGDGAEAREQTAAAWRAMGGAWHGSVAALVTEQAADAEERMGRPEAAAELLGLAEALRGLPDTAGAEARDLAERLRGALGAAGLAAIREDAAKTAPEEAIHRVSAALDAWDAAPSEGAEER
ncbi:winged helix-turn-helix domain-containing protein [Nocardiopsis sp. CNT-189]|uniref:ATP-binding protein n=1 Tax=Nocardiopsis oceanisediminis TaxID=2816862 RepID=UPI003B305A4F